MDICSPKDGFVIKLSVREGDEVKVGSPLIQMDSDNEDRQLEAVQTAESIREIRAAQFAGKQLDLLRSMAKLSVDLAAENVKQTESRFKKSEIELKNGTVKPENVLMSRSDWTVALLEQTKAEVRQEQLEFAISRHNQTYTIAKQKSEDLQAFIAKRKELLTIVAPKVGRVKDVLVAEGLFSEIGGVLLVIE